MLNKIGNIEEFSQGDKKGYKITGAVFASSKNHNGCHFDPLEVFTVDNPPSTLNFAHKDKTTDYSTDTTITSKPVASIKGKLLEFTWDLETTNENFIELIKNENFGGFSPELAPQNYPTTNARGERFYKGGDLVWRETAILGKNQKPGFVGADKFALESFEAFEDVVILDEKFEYCEFSTGEYVKTKDGKLGKITEIKILIDAISYQIQIIGGENIVIIDKKTESYLRVDGDFVIKRISTNDIMEYLLTQNPLTQNTVDFAKPTDLPLDTSPVETPKVETPKVENFEKERADFEDRITALESEKTALKTQIKNTENFTTAPKLPDTIEKFSKTGSVENKLTDEEIQKAKQSLRGKI